MVGIILASHGEFANGIKQSGEMIFGPQQDVVACTLMPSDGPDDIRKKMEAAVESFQDKKQVLFLIDLFGGTPFNQASLLIKGHEDSWAIVTGLSLPMLIEAYATRMSDENAQSVAKHIIEVAREGVKPIPASLEETKKVEETKASKKNTIPEGTVVGDGKINYVLSRIDTRLLHGQVCTTWTKMTRPDRIVVVSDNVAHDALRKEMIIQACPPGCKAYVIPVDKMIQVAKDPRFGGQRMMLLFETPQDALRAVKGGVDIKEMNLGSMAHSKGKVVLTKAVAADADDVKTLEELASKGIKFNVQKVPADSPENFESMIKKAKELLSQQQ